MKLLHWHKLANEAALKAALIRTKNMKQADSRTAPRETLQEKASWMQQLIEEEQAKPLQVGKDFIKKYEEEEARGEAALTRQVEHHIKLLELALRVSERHLHLDPSPTVVNGKAFLHTVAESLRS